MVVARLLRGRHAMPRLATDANNHFEFALKGDRNLEKSGIKICAKGLLESGSNQSVNPVSWARAE